MKKKRQMSLLNSHTCQKGFPLLHAYIAVALSSIIGDLEAMQDLQADVLVNLDSMLMVTDKQQIIVCDSLSLLFGLYDNAQIRMPMTNLLYSRTEYEDNQLLPILGLDDMVEFNRVIKEAGPLHKFIVNESHGLGQTTKKVLFQEKSEVTPFDKDRSGMNPGQAQFDMSNLETESSMLSNIILISILSGISALSIETLNANKTGSNSNISDLFLLKQDQIHDVSMGFNKKNISDKVVKSTDENFESSINDSATKLNLGKSVHENADDVNNANPAYEIKIESVSRQYLEDNNITLEDSIFDHEDVQIGLLDVNDDGVKDIVVYNKNSSATIFIDGSSELLVKNNERLFFKSIADPMLYSSQEAKEIQKEFLDEIFSDQLYYESGLKSHYDSCVKGARWLLQNASLQQTGEWPDLYSIGIRGNAWDMLEKLIYHGASYQMLSDSSLSEDVTSLHGLRLFHEYNNSLDITVVDYYKNFNMESVVYRDSGDDINMAVTREYFVDGSYQEYYSSDVLSVTPARYAMAIVHRNGDVSTYGIEGLGGGETVPNQLKNIIEVYANDLSFLALDSDKKLHSWGHVSAFGNIPSYVEAKDVVSTSLSYAIAPVNLSDRITLLGHKQYGGYYSEDSDVLISSDLLSSDGSSYYIVKESDDIAFGKVNHYNEDVFSSYESYLSELDRIKLINDKYVMESISSLDSLKNMDLMKGDIIFTAYYLSDYTIIGYESPGINHATHVSYVAEKNDELYVVSVENGWIHAYTLDDFINMNTDHFMLPVAVARPDYASLYRSSDNYTNEYTLIVGDEVSGQFIDRDSNYIDRESQIHYVEQQTENASTSLYGYGVAQSDHEESQSVLYVNDLPYQIDTVLHAVTLAIIQ